MVRAGHDAMSQSVPDKGLVPNGSCSGGKDTMNTSSAISQMIARFSHLLANGRRTIDRRSDRKLNALMNSIMTKDTKVIDMA